MTTEKHVECDAVILMCDLVMCFNNREVGVVMHLGFFYEIDESKFCSNNSAVEYNNNAQVMLTK